MAAAERLFLSLVRRAGRLTEAAGASAFVPARHAHPEPRLHALAAQWSASPAVRGYTALARKAPVYELRPILAGESGYRPPLAVDADSHSPAALAEQGDEPSTNTEADDLKDDAVQLQYRLEVVTGTVRGAGTPNMATVQLFGASAASPVYRIGDDDDNRDGSGFERGSVKTYAIRAPQLGALRRIHIKKDLHRASELGSGWFLERIVVTGPEGHELMFPCHAWIGETDDGSGTAEFERNLLPCIKPVPADDAAALPASISARGAGIAIPHPEKVKNGVRGVNHRNHGHAGEDAYFYTPGALDTFGLGVADGIYMWREHGIDAGVFARTLMDTAQHMTEAGYSDVLRITQICQRKVQTEGIYGSSTFCLAVIDRANSRMHTACLGDSGFMLLGSTKENPEMHIKYRTSPQEHEFGRPFQLGSHPNADRPEDAMLASILVTAGDVVIVGSDGLWDNLFDRQIAEVAARHRAASSAPNPAALARELASMAHAESVNRRAFTPYSYAASEWFDMVYDGGKPDDISIVAAFIEAN